MTSHFWEHASTVLVVIYYRFVEEDHRASTHHMLKQRVMRMVSGMLSLWVVTVMARVDVQKHDFNTDASDYKLLKDVGFWLPQIIKKLNMVKNLKYIGNKIHNSFSPLFNSFLDIVNSFLHFFLLDPTYMIRAVQPMHQTMFTVHFLLGALFMVKWLVTLDTPVVLSMENQQTFHTTG
ncbi:unnamed protein product [Brassica rapa subsp. trilocularis]